jgi:hypothetical protein
MIDLIYLFVGRAQKFELNLTPAALQYMLQQNGGIDRRYSLGCEIVGGLP